MAALDSDKVAAALVQKLKCQVEDAGDHIRFVVRDEKNMILSRTKISHGPKHTIGDDLIVQMARQIKLGTTKNFLKCVECSLSQEECIAIIKASS